jgi:hypothetical protein
MFIVREIFSSFMPFYSSHISYSFPRFIEGIIFFSSFHTAVLIITLFIMSVKHNYILLITPDTGCLLLTTCFGHSSTIMYVKTLAFIDLMMVDECPKHVVNNRQPVSGVISKI